MPGGKRVCIVHANDRGMDQILAGIDEVRREGLDWQIRHQYEPPRNAREVADVLDFRPDGLLSAAALPPALHRPPCPWVSVRSREAPMAVLNDDRLAGEQAADHLASLGAAVLAVLCERPEEDEPAGWKRERRRGFESGAARHGQRVHRILLDDPAHRQARGPWLLAQLAALPRPVALFTGNDWYAFEVLEILLAAGVRVPAEVALLGADDWPRCAAAAVPLSSVRIGHREAGRRAALLLRDAMAGRPAPGAVVVPPAGVAARASTDAIAVQDPEVAEALAAIRRRIGEPFAVDDVVAASRLRRRALEQRFRRVLGRSILAEIHRQRIAHAQVLLRTGQAGIAEVAQACGFADAPHFTTVFRKLVGVPPSAWRARERGGT